MRNSTYAQFEDKHRGSLESVYSKLEVYKPLLSEFKRYEPKARLADLGCGRGEFLKIATDLSIDCLGVDLNDDMLNVARKIGLKVKKIEVLDFLNSQEDDSFDILAAFHLIEHLNLNYLMKVFDQVKRVIKPGGLIILETPNPENIVVSTCNFYMDITHVRPLPPGLLKFIFRKLDFNNINLWGLNSKEKTASEPIAMIDVLAGVSPDYALLALKKGVDNTNAGVIKEMEVSRGVSLNQLASRYEQRWSQDFKSVQNQMEQSQRWVKNELLSIENRFKQYGSNLESLHSEVKEELSSFEEQIYFYQTELHNVTTSRSWKLTRPLRKLGKLIRNFKVHVKNFFFDFKNLPIRVFLKKYCSKIFRKTLPIIFSNRFTNKLSTTKSLINSKEKKFLSILEKIQKEK